MPWATKVASLLAHCSGHLPHPAPHRLVPGAVCASGSTWLPGHPCGAAGLSAASVGWRGAGSVLTRNFLRGVRAGPGARERPHRASARPARGRGWERRGQLGQCPWGFVPAGGLSPSSQAVPRAGVSDGQQPGLTAQAQPVLSQPCSRFWGQEGLQPLSQTTATIPWTTSAVPQWEIRHGEGAWGQRGRGGRVMPWWRSGLG